MKKIRINELARELEVKPGIIIDLLPELGVQEKKTHASSIEEETAIALRERLAASGVLGSFPANGQHHDHDEEGPSQDAPSSLDAPSMSVEPETHSPEPVDPQKATVVSAHANASGAL